MVKKNEVEGVEDIAEEVLNNPKKI